MKNIRSRFLIVAFTLVFAIYLLIPTILKFSGQPPVPKNPKEGSPWYHHILPSESLKLGLDLKGGLHFVLGIDFEEVYRDSISKMKTQVDDIASREKIEGVTYDTTRDNKLVIKAPNAEAWKKLDENVGKNLYHMIALEKAEGNGGTFAMTESYRGQVKRQALEQSRETLRNRIDEFGIAEPDIKIQGEEKIMVEFPGVTDPTRLKDIISRTAKLTFQIVHTAPEEQRGDVTYQQLNDWVAQFQKEKNIKPDATKSIAGYTKELNAWLETKVPKGTEILFHRRVNINTKEAEYQPYLLERQAMIAGEDLQDAYLGYDPQDNNPMVYFQLTPVGSTKFEKATGDNVGRLMAIILDGNVHSAPVIRQRIGGGRAQIEMGTTGRSLEEIQNDAKDTALVLRSGALPARLEFLEERVVGPSLGADSIRAGSYALSAGLFLVFGFLIIYYKTSGAIACLALALNSLFIMAAMAAFEGTLTLPGLAGITLTLGMAVDANVLILERVREELKLGKSFALALSEGYSHASSAIWDGNITAMIAGLVLLQFGYGPIRGFAVTTLIGLTASLYTAVYITRLVYDYLIHVKNVESIRV
jgi:preprotein translocase subunit SecD